VYRNEVQMWIEDPQADVPGSSISRGMWYVVPASCSIPKYGNVNGSFTPTDNVVIAGEVEGWGKYEVFFYFYKDETYTVSLASSTYAFTNTFILIS